MGSEGRIGNFSTPSVHKISEHGRGNAANILENAGDLEEFENLLKEQETKGQDGIEFSHHAVKRLKDRNLEIDSEEFLKLRSAINKLKDKGGQEALVITNKAAYIVDVNDRRVVTAIDKNNVGDNVFTKIDSTLVLN